MGNPLFTLAGLPVTAYALGLALSVAFGACLAGLCLKKAGQPARTAQIFLLLALPLGLFLARLMYVLIRLPFFIEWGEGLAFRLWQGGYSVWGAVAAFLLAGCLTARLTRQNPGALLDRLLPAALVLLALARCCEGLAGQGFGQEVPAGLAFFPLAVGNEWGEFRYAIFMLEAAGALLILFLVYRRPGKVPGLRTRLALGLFCALQILFESLREDQVLSWGFVKVSQVFAACTLLALMVEGLYLRQSAAWPWPRHLALTSLVLLITVVGLLEYALDKSNLNTLLIYALMSLAVLGLGLLLRKSLAGSLDRPSPKTLEVTT